jgi:hypothetical protein
MRLPRKSNGGLIMLKGSVVPICGTMRLMFGKALRITRKLQTIKGNRKISLMSP